MVLCDGSWGEADLVAMRDDERAGHSAGKGQLPNLGVGGTPFAFLSLNMRSEWATWQWAAWSQRVGKGGGEIG